MNTQHSVWIMVQMTRFKTIVMSKSILFWRRVVLIRDISVFHKDRLLANIQSLLGEFSKGYNILRPTGRIKTAARDHISGKQNVPTCLEDREVGSFQNLTWLSLPHMLARGGSTVRHERMNWVRDMPDQKLHFLPSFNGVYSMPGIMCFNGSSL